MSVSKRLRYEILRRDQHTCRYCGAAAPDVPLRVDHVVPVALGGTDVPANLVTACQDCNSGKSSAAADHTLVADVADDALRWAAAMQQAAENLREHEKPKEEYRANFLELWNRWHVGKDETKKVPLPGEWRQSIERFRVAGVPAWMWPDIVEAAMTNQKVKPDSTFRYVCGIAWNKVTALQAEARRIVGLPGGTSAPDLIADALITLCVAVWGDVQGKDATPKEREELTQSVLAAHAAEKELDEIVRAAKHAAYFSNTTVDAGFEDLAQDERLQADVAWTNAWITVTGQYPSRDDCQAFWANCEALYEDGAGVPEVKTAGFVAGYHRSTVPHFGLTREQLDVIGVHPYKERALDLWVRAFDAVTGRWPTPDEKRRVAEQLDRLIVDGGYKVGDAFAAVVAAAGNQETDLHWNIPRQLSALIAAASPMPGEGV